MLKTLGQEYLKLLGQAECLDHQARKFKIVRLGSFELVKLLNQKFSNYYQELEKSRKRGTRNHRSTHVTKTVTKTVIYEKRSVK